METIITLAIILFLGLLITAIGITVTEAGAKEIYEKVSKGEWLKFVELAR